MSSRQSPAVAFPLRTPKVLQVVWGLGSACSAFVLLAWWFQGAGYGLQWWLRMGVSAAVWAGCAWVGWRALLQMPQGTLRWDGKNWLWEQAEHVTVLQGAPAVLADLQWLLVLRWSGEQGQVQRVVVQRDWAPHVWLDLRRAVYSSAYPTQDAVKNQVP